MIEQLSKEDKITDMLIKEEYDEQSWVFFIKDPSLEIHYTEKEGYSAWKKEMVHNLGLLVYIGCPWM